MKRMIGTWNALLCGEALLGIRAQAVVAFLAVAGISVARVFHWAGLTDFFSGAALALSGILMIQTFRLESAETKDEAARGMTELHLSR